MINLYVEKNKKLLILNQNVTSESIEKNMWIELISPTDEEIKLVVEKTKIPEHFIYEALDEEENAHVDFEEGQSYIVLDTPCIEENSVGVKTFSTTPFGIIYNDEYFVTVASKKTSLVDSIIAKVKKLEPHKHVRLTLNIMDKLAANFISCLKKIDSQTKEIEKILHSSMRNKELFDLMELNKTLVYFSTALNANKLVIAKITRLDEFKKYQEDYDLIEDVKIENDQAIEMCSIYRDILSGTMDAFASIISNNLNIVMKVLAVITIILSIPTLIASFFGMNFANIPLYDSKWGFWIVVIMSIIAAIGGSIALFLYTKTAKRYHLLRFRKRK